MKNRALVANTRNEPPGGPLASALRARGLESLHCPTVAFEPPENPGELAEALGALEPSFKTQGEVMPGFDGVIQQRYPEIEKIEHVHHAGNSSGIVDGAAGVLIGTKEMGQALGLKPRARILGGASIGAEPSIMLTGPEHVTHGNREWKRPQHALCQDAETHRGAQEEKPSSVALGRAHVAEDPQEK